MKSMMRLLPLIFVAKATVDQADASSQEINQEASSYLARAMEVGRQIIAGALPPELETQDWSIAARRHIQSLHGDVSVTWKIDSAALQVSEPLALTCYRVTCEAVGNAVVHGAATEVLVESCVDTGLSLAISDNGSGFDPKAVPDDRFGIRSMKGRAAALGGRLDIESSGNGTTIRFTATYR